MYLLLYDRTCLLAAAPLDFSVLAAGILNHLASFLNAVTLLGLTIGILELNQLVLEISIILDQPLIKTLLKFQSKPTLLLRAYSRRVEVKRGRYIWTFNLVWLCLKLSISIIGITVGLICRMITHHRAPIRTLHIILYVTLFLLSSYLCLFLRNLHILTT